MSHQNVPPMIHAHRNKSTMPVLCASPGGLVRTCPRLVVALGSYLATTCAKAGYSNTAIGDAVKNFTGGAATQVGVLGLTFPLRSAIQTAAIHPCSLGLSPNASFLKAVVAFKESRQTLSGLYSGLGPTAGLGVVLRGVNFISYDAAQKSYPENPVKQVGFCVGTDIAAMGVLYPLEVISKQRAILNNVSDYKTLNKPEPEKAVYRNFGEFAGLRAATGAIWWGIFLNWNSISPLSNSDQSKQDLGTKLADKVFRGIASGLSTDLLLPLNNAIVQSQTTHLDQSVLSCLQRIIQESWANSVSRTQHPVGRSVATVKMIFNGYGNRAIVGSIQGVLTSLGLSAMESEK